MDKVEKIIIAVGILISASIIFYFVYLVPPPENYKLSEYSCEQLKESLIESSCLVRVNSWAVNHCYKLEEIEASYKYRGCSQNGDSGKVDVEDA